METLLIVAPVGVPLLWAHRHRRNEDWRFFEALLAHFRVTRLAGLWLTFNHQLSLASQARRRASARTWTSVGAARKWPRGLRPL